MARSRDQRGVALPSPVVLLSIVAIAMAAIAYLATQGAPPTEREVAIVARDESPSAAPDADAAAPASPSQEASPKPKRTPKPVPRSEILVDVYNNSGITGLAGEAGGAAAGAGWQVATTDNWYGSVPENTVYFPPDLQRAGRQLALDLGVQRTLPAVGSMNPDRLTVILTGPLG